MRDVRNRARGTRKAPLGMDVLDSRVLLSGSGTQSVAATAAGVSTQAVVSQATYSILLDSLTPVPDGPGLRVTYHFEGTPPVQPDIVLFWATGPSWQDRIRLLDSNTGLLTTTEAGSGHSNAPIEHVPVGPGKPYTVDIQTTSPRPVGTTYLLAVTAPPNHAPNFGDTAQVPDSRVLSMPSVVMPVIYYNGPAKG